MDPAVLLLVLHDVAHELEAHHCYLLLDDCSELVKWWSRSHTVEVGAVVIAQGKCKCDKDIRVTFGSPEGKPKVRFWPVHYEFEKITNAILEKYFPP